MFVGGLLLIGVAINQYQTGGKIQWAATSAVLSKTRMDERLRNKVEELIISLTYQYQVNGVSYDAFSEEIVLSESHAQIREVQIQETQSTIPIYYQIENPEETTFNEEDTKPDQGLLYVVIPTGAIITIVGFWLLSVWYKYVFC